MSPLHRGSPRHLAGASAMRSAGGAGQRLLRVAGSTGKCQGGGEPGSPRRRPAPFTSSTVAAMARRASTPPCGPKVARVSRRPHRTTDATARHPRGDTPPLSGGSPPTATMACRSPTISSLRPSLATPAESRSGSPTSAAYPTDEGRLYLAVVLDLFSRKVVRSAMRDHLRQELTIAALTMAIQRQRPGRGLLRHFRPGPSICRRRLPRRR